MRESISNDIILALDVVKCGTKCFKEQTPSDNTLRIQIGISQIVMTGIDM
jgi:hypothetical protein